MNIDTEREQLFSLLPHRPPMLLLNRVIAVDNKKSEAEVIITADSPFFIADKGVPAWIGIEYMGQTAALIAGYQQQKQPKKELQLGFLLGTRRYSAHVDWFFSGKPLYIYCEEEAIVGDSLATFSCRIEADQVLAQANLTVYRKAIGEKKNSQSTGGKK